MNPTTAEPGTAEKVLVMIERYALRLPIFHPGGQPDLQHGPRQSGGEADLRRRENNQRDRIGPEATASAGREVEERLMPTIRFLKRIAEERAKAGEPPVYSGSNRTGNTGRKKVVPKLSKMKQAIAEARQANGEPPLEKYRCCTSGVDGRHTRTCPMHGRDTPTDPQDIAEFLRKIQGHPKRKGK